MANTSREVKRHGKHYTPTLLADFLAERVLGQLRGQLGNGAADIRVLDPACGDGELLLAIHRIAAQTIPEAKVSLVGYDLDGEAVAVACARAAERSVTIDLHEGDFLQAGRELPRGVFDAVITNPPYVRTQQLGQETAQTLAAEFGLTGRIDLTHPFVTLVPQLLRGDGVLGLLCSNRFLTTKAGANVRSVLQTALDPVELFDLGDTKLFQAAVLPAIVVALNRNAQRPTQCPYSSAYETDAASTSEGTLYEALVADRDSIVFHDGRSVAVRSGKLRCGDSSAEPWRLVHAEGEGWLSTVSAATWRTFGDVAKIRVGIKTTADKVFISDSWNRVNPEPEKELLRPLITQENLTAWRVSDHLPTQVLYPYDMSKTRRTLVDMDQYPATMAHFESHARQLKGRKYVTDGGREWFEIWVPQKPHSWALPKIVFPDISVNARFAIDESGAIVNGNCYWISFADIGDEDIAYLMLAVANSALGLRFYDEVCGNKLYSGRRRWMTQYVARLPLPDPSIDASQELVQRTRELVGAPDAPRREQLELIDKLVEAAFAKPLTGSHRVAPPSMLF